MKKYNRVKQDEEVSELFEKLSKVKTSNLDEFIKNIPLNIRKKMYKESVTKEQYEWTNLLAKEKQIEEWNKSLKYRLYMFKRAEAKEEYDGDLFKNAFNALEKLYKRERSWGKYNDLLNLWEKEHTDVINEIGERENITEIYADELDFVKSISDTVKQYKYRSTVIFYDYSRRLLWIE